jgi:transcription initiation factor TFIIB
LIIFDAERGEYIDTETGEVVEDRVVDQGPEWRVYNHKDRLERERTGSPLTLKIHDEGLSTRIGYGKVKDRIKLMKMKRLQNWIRISSNKEKKLVTYLSMLNREASKLGLPEHVKETAAFILRKLIENGLTRRIAPKALIAIVLYHSCQVNNVPISLKEFKAKFNVSTSEFWKATRRIKTIIPEFRPTIIPTKYIPKIIDKLNLPPIVGTKAAELIDYMYKNGLASGKNYLSLSAAAVYVVSILMDNRKSQKEVAKALNIAEATIRYRYKEIVDILGPIRYICKNCGYELYRFEEVGQDYYGVRSPSEIKSMFGGKCPRCGHELGDPSLTGKLEVII